MKDYTGLADGQYRYLQAARKFRIECLCDEWHDLSRQERRQYPKHVPLQRVDGPLFDAFDGVQTILFVSGMSIIAFFGYCLAIA